MSIQADDIYFAVITPYAGGPWIEDCILSVQAQTHRNFCHYIVLDSPQYGEQLREIVAKFSSSKIRIFELPEPTGSNGYRGHRIYGGSVFLINADYFVFLDDDNFFLEHHLTSFAALIHAHDLDWLYSLRKIYSRSGEFLTDDNCESLGIWGAWCNGQSMVDTSCYCIRREVAIQSAPIWYRKGYSSLECDPDKALCRHLIHNYPKCFTTGEYSVAYRLGASDQSVALQYFLDGNSVMSEIYRKFPWVRPKLQRYNSATCQRRMFTEAETLNWGADRWLL